MKKMKKTILLLLAAAAIGVQAENITVNHDAFSVAHSLTVSKNPQTFVMQDGKAFRVGGTFGHRKAATAYSDFKQSLEACKEKFIAWEAACKASNLNHARTTVKINGWFDVYQNGKFVPSQNSVNGLVGTFEMTPEGASFELSTADVVKFNPITKQSVKMSDGAKITFRSAEQIQALIDQIDYDKVKTQLDAKKASGALLN